ncbi:hypothetical protein Bbelb_146840 [Branchiostoma belcheri]|nr:hypothetical protein Bbelb_146840 [Branchiostoma belcheri]
MALRKTRWAPRRKRGWEKGLIYEEPRGVIKHPPEDPTRDRAGTRVARSWEIKETSLSSLEDLEIITRSQCQVHHLLGQNISVPVCVLSEDLVEVNALLALVCRVGLRRPRKRAIRLTNVAPRASTVTTRRTCFCVLSRCKNVGKRRAPVRGEYRLRTESYGFGSTQTRRRTLSACKTFSTCGLRIHHPYVRATRVPRTCRAEEARVSTASLR